VTAHGKIKDRARRIQTITELPYTTCLSLAHGDVTFVPKKSGCDVVAALKEVKGDKYVSPTYGIPCKCKMCNQ